MGAQSLRTVVSAPQVNYTRNGQPATIWGLAGSASRRDKTITLTMVNPSPDTARTATVALAGASVRSCATRTLNASALDAHNSFAQPEAVPSPASVPVALTGGELVLAIPAASVVAATLQIA